MLPNDAKARKERPIARGVLEYFPDAIAEVARVSYVGSKQHHPDEPMHWDKSKSPDHADCLARHLIERGTVDTDGLRHSAKAAWRALALLQIEIEGGGKKETIRRMMPEEFIDLYTPTQKFFDRPERERDFCELIRLGCPDSVARMIVMGTTYLPTNRKPELLGYAPQYAYLAGPMRGLPGFNFPAFDAARDQLVKQGYNVISPADIDRHDGVTDSKTEKQERVAKYVFRDLWALYFLANRGKGNAIIMLPGWRGSTGATAEYGVAKWLELCIREIGEFEKPVYHHYRKRHRSWPYRVVDGQVEFLLPDGVWDCSNDYPTVEAFNAAIQKGELVPCESSPSNGSPSSDTKDATKSAIKGE